jgi:hypothetical protein
MMKMPTHHRVGSVSQNTIENCLIITSPILKVIDQFRITETIRPKIYTQVIRDNSSELHSMGSSA